jgi:hypothetical protein
MSDVVNRLSGQSAAVAYLSPSVLRRPNLTVAVATTAEKLLFDEPGSEPRALGVEVSKSAASPKYRVKADREVVLCGADHGHPLNFGPCFHLADKRTPRSRHSAHLLVSSLFLPRFILMDEISSPSSPFKPAQSHLLLVCRYLTMYLAVSTA